MFNDVRSHHLPQAFYGSMVAAGSALYAHAQELKATLAKATTVEEIAAVVW